MEEDAVSRAMIFDAHITASFGYCLTEVE